MNNNRLSKLWIGLMLALLLPVSAFAETYTYDAAGRLTTATYTDGSSVTYTYDANGNILNKTIAAAGTVTDTTKPVITLLGTTPLTIAHGSTYNDAGATAADNVDGNITANIVTVNPVNVNVIGAYTVTYNVSDAATNAATQVTRTVNVTDQTAPVITLLGTTPLTIAHGSVYNDAGATALDNVDGNITANIVTVNPVNTAVVGAYTVTYNVSDTATNAATQVTRTVNVTDQTAPVITRLGASPQTVAFGSVYTDAGATANDNVDGNITANIVTVNPVNVNVIGAYTVTYNVSDAATNAATQVTRMVNVTDQTAPVITRLGISPLTIAQGSVYSDSGATASDNVDGNITANIATVNPVNTAIVGTYTVIYNVSDTAINAATQVTRTVHVTDQTAPVITLLGTTPLTIAHGSVYNDAGATVLDNVDGNITANIVTANPVNINVIGTYTVTYNVSDAATNPATQVIRTVNVTDQTAPVITVAGASPAIVVQNSVYTDAGATAMDNIDGAVNVVTTGAVNTGIAGVYALTYTATDAATNSATATRQVKVTAPGTTAAGSTTQLPIAGSTTTVDIVSTNEVISNFSATSTAGTTPPAGVSFPFGVVSYTTSVTPGGSQTVNLTFSTALSANLVLYKVDNAGAYTLIPNGAGVDQWTQVNATTVALTLSDGGQFDLDGNPANGVIVDPVAVGNGGTSVPFVSSSGGCSITASSNASVDPLMPVLVLLSMFWLAIRWRRGGSVLAGA